MGRRLFGAGLALASAAFGLFASTAVAASGFVPAETLTGAGAGVPAGPVQVAMASNGTAIAAWVETLAGGQSAVRIATRVPGGPWSAPQQLDVSTLSKTGFPLSVAIASDGAAAVAWDDAPGLSDTAEVTTRAAGQQQFPVPHSLGNQPDPVVGIDGSDQVTMIDDNAGTEVAWTWAAGAAFPVSSTQLASNCSSFLVPADLAVAPGGDAIAGMNCGGPNSGGDTFVRRIAGSWKTPGSVPIQNLTSNTCPGTPSEFRRGQALSVAIDSTGHPAAAFVEDDSTGCTPTTTDAYTLSLLVPTSTGMQSAPAAVDTSSTFSFFIGNSLASPSVAIAAGNPLIAWDRASFTGSTGEFDARQYDSSGAPTSAIQPLQTNSFSGSISLAENSAGAALAVFPASDAKGVNAAARPPGGTFPSAPVAATSAGGGASAGLDDAGDGVVGFATTAPGAETRGFDGTPPTVSNAAIPATGTVGTPVSFSVAASDFWGPVSVTWSFGDGTTAGGATVSHTFTAPAARSVTLTATDAVGNAVSRSGRLVVSAIPPVLSKVSQTHSSFRVGSSPTAVNARASKRKRKPPTGTTFSYTLNVPAGVVFAFTHGAPGRRSGSHCVKPSKRLRSHRACTRVVSNGRITRHGVAGGNRLAFSGRIGGKALAPGSYAVTLTPTAFAVAGRPRTLKFTIVR